MQVFGVFLGALHLQSTSPLCPLLSDGSWEFLEAVASVFSAMRRTSALLRFWLLPSHFSAQGPLGYPDGVLSRFLRQRVHDKYAFYFHVDHIAMFWVFGGVPEVSCDPLVLLRGLGQQWSIVGISQPTGIGLGRMRTPSASTLRMQCDHIFIRMFGGLFEGEN